MSEPLLRIERVSRHFGGFAALTDVSLEVAPGERFGLIGPNGSGKTTLINCVSGALSNDSGSIVFAGEAITKLPAYQRTRRGIARSFQLPRPFTSMSVMENLIVPLEFVVHRHSLHNADTRAEAMDILEKIGLADKAHTASNRLTQVDLRKLELARAIAAKPKLLISDEAMAGLSTAESDDILTLLFRLNDEGMAVIMIEHIMRTVMKFSERVAVLVAGRKIADGDPRAVAADPEVVRAYLGE